MESRRPSVLSCMLLGLGSFTGLIVAASITGATLAAGAAAGGDCAWPNAPFAVTMERSDRTPIARSLLAELERPTACWIMEPRSFGPP